MSHFVLGFDSAGPGETSRSAVLKKSLGWIWRGGGGDGKDGVAGETGWGTVRMRRWSEKTSLQAVEQEGAGFGQ